MYAKLFSRITESSLMEEQIPVRYTFVMLLAIADPTGLVVGTEVALARRLNMPLTQFKKCVQTLQKPDPHSNSKEEDGRRLIPSEGERGYQIVNFVKYRDLRDEDARRSYMRSYMKNYRGSKHDVNTCKQPLTLLAQADADVPVEENAKASKTFGEIEEQAISIYELYPLKVKKPEAIKSIIKAIREFGHAHVAAKTREYAAVRAGNKAFTPHPATFFNQQMFNDDPDTWKPYENNASSNKKGFDRNKGTYNEGKAHLYKVKPAPAIPVSDPQRPAIADNAGSG